MKELRITRSKDIELYIGDEQLFGVIDFSSKEISESYPIREYLSGEPFELINGRSEYELRLSVLSLFRYAALDGGDLRLSIVDGDTTYLYEGCTVIRHDKSVKAGRNVVDEYVIAAKSMSEVARDAG